MNRELKFRRNLWGVATILVAILGFAFALASRNTTQAQAVFEWSAHTEEVLDKISQARFGRARLMNQLWAFRVTQNPEVRLRFHDDIESVRKIMDELRVLTADTPQQRQMLEELAPLVAAQLVSLQEAMDEAAESDTSRADLPAWSLPAVASPGRVRRYRHWARHRAPHHTKARRPRVGRIAARPGRVFLLLRAAWLGRRCGTQRADWSAGMTDRCEEILLVEDDPADAELTLMAIGKEKLTSTIHVVRDGAEALDFVFCRGCYAARKFERPPTLILLDLKLPKVSGHQVLRAVKSDPRTRPIPIVVLTSSAQDRDLIECYRAGSNSYIQKPVDLQQFQDTIRNFGAYWLRVNQPPPKAPFADSDRGA